MYKNSQEKIGLDQSRINEVIKELFQWNTKISINKVMMDAMQSEKDILIRYLNIMVS